MTTVKSSLPLATVEALCGEIEKIAEDQKKGFPTRMVARLHIDPKHVKDQIKNIILPVGLATGAGVAASMYVNRALEGAGLGLPPLKRKDIMAAGAAATYLLSKYTGDLALKNRKEVLKRLEDEWAERRAKA